MGITGGLDALLRVNVVREHMYTICERSVRSAANDILHGAPTIGSTDKFAIYADVASDIHCFALKVFGKIYKYGLACQLATLQKFIIRRVVDVTLAVVSMRASARGTTTSDEAASLAHITFIIDGAAPAMKHPVRSVRRRGSTYTNTDDVVRYLGTHLVNDTVLPNLARESLRTQGFPHVRFQFVRGVSEGEVAAVYCPDITCPHTASPQYACACISDRVVVSYDSDILVVAALSNVVARPHRFTISAAGIRKTRSTVDDQAESPTFLFLRTPDRYAVYIWCAWLTQGCDYLPPIYGGCIADKRQRIFELGRVHIERVLSDVHMTSEDRTATVRQSFKCFLDALSSSTIVLTNSRRLALQAHAASIVDDAAWLFTYWCNMQPVDMSKCRSSAQTLMSRRER